ncbi:hypothetical protein [Blastococcus haudaquaticus]|uniref:Immunity protein 21 n=1 Tax=Blastococcus haudaquaticus TaxID=1938745 RepID=A0A286GQD0_9ACTN|nr:hypothetical protein [Blastococcus haudaquaticus]SOD97396.1 hypothetical protein SAMN06272739_1458 [Blastococcus haudaquaticus]
MPRTWSHVGRCWTNGEPFLALDADLLGEWFGMSGGAYERLVPDLSYEKTSVPIGRGSAALVLTDGDVGDEGWLEVFRDDDGAIAIIQAGGPDYPGILGAALAHPTDDDEDGDSLSVPTGRLALISAALDGWGPDGAPLAPESSGPAPTSSEYDAAADDAGGPLLRVLPGTYRLSIRWMVELDDESAFARWLLTPA